VIFSVFISELVVIVRFIDIIRTLLLPVSSVHVVRNMDTVSRAVWREEMPGFGDPCDTGTDFSPNTLVFSCHHPTSDPYSCLTHIPPVLYFLCIISIIALLILNDGRYPFFFLQFSGNAQCPK